MLARACEQGDASEVESLIRAGINVDAAHMIFQGAPVPPILMAVRQKNAACTKLLVDANANVNIAVGPEGETPLHVACARGNLEAVKTLIDAGADVNPADSLGRTPLLYCCLESLPMCCDLMIEARADIEKPMTVHNPGATPLYAAALVGCGYCVSLLCEAGANVNAQTANGATPMLVAYQEGNRKAAMVLSSFGANRGAQYVLMGFPPHGASWADDLAARSGNDQLIDWLAESVDYSALHHVQVLTPERTLALLRDGASPVHGKVTPAQLARKHEETHAGNQACRLILLAADPWSPETHELWGAAHRARAVEVLKIGYLLASKHAGCAYQSFIDAWSTHLLPLAIVHITVPPAIVPPLSLLRPCSRKRKAPMKDEKGRVVRHAA